MRPHTNKIIYAIFPQSLNRHFGIANSTICITILLMVVQTFALVEFFVADANNPFC